jgi:hypothetical protein
MAGLLDIFGTGGGESLGLLGGNIEQSRNDAQANALYALAGSLLSGGPTGLSIVKGLQQGGNAYRDTMKDATQDQMGLYQLQELKRKKDLEQAALARQQQIDRAVAGAYQPAQAAQEIYGEDMMGQRVGEGVTPGRAAGLDLQSLAPALMASPEGRKTLSELVTAQKAMGGETFSLAEGATQYVRDPITGKVTQVASGAPKKEATPAAIAEYQFAKSQGYGGSMLDYELAKKRAGASNTTVNMPSEGERKAATLASRLNFSVGQLNEAVGRDPSAAMPKTSVEMARYLSGADFLPNKLNSEQRQIVEAAQEDILDAALTLGTGAAYSREQLAGYKKSYFPQLGDTPASVESKQKRLNNLLKSAEVASGRAASQITAPIPDLPKAPKKTPTVSGW